MQNDTAILPVDDATRKKRSTKPSRPSNPYFVVFLDDADQPMRNSSGDMSLGGPLKTTQAAVKAARILYRSLKESDHDKVSRRSTIIGVLRGSSPDDPDARLVARFPK